jgi:hypothetical protein
MVNGRMRGSCSSDCDVRDACATVRLVGGPERIADADADADATGCLHSALDTYHRDGAVCCHAMLLW